MNPQTIEYEQRLIGSLFYDTELLRKIRTILLPSDFYDTRNMLIYKTMVQMWDVNLPIDLTTVKDKLLQTDRTAVTPQFIDYLAAIMDSTASPMNAVYYAEKVKEAANRRSIMAKAQAVITAIKEHKPQEDILNLKRELELHKDNLYRPQELRELHAEAEEWRNINRDGYQMVTSLSILDTYTHGLQKSAVYVFVADTSHGKSAFAAQLIVENLKMGRFVKYYSYDLPAFRFWTRLVQYWGEFSTDGMLTQWRHNPDLEKHIHIASSEFAETMQGRITIREYSTLTQIEQDISASETDILAVDYIQSAAAREGLSPTNEVANIARYVNALKILAKRYKVSLVEISQFRRPAGLMPRGHKREMYEIKGSGEIENLADCVILMNWAGRHSKEKFGDDYSISVTKSNMGRTGYDMPFSFCAPYQRFTNPDSVLTSQCITCIRRTNWEGCHRKTRSGTGKD